MRTIEHTAVGCARTVNGRNFHPFAASTNAFEAFVDDVSYEPALAMAPDGSRHSLTQVCPEVSGAIAAGSIGPLRSPASRSFSSVSCVIVATSGSPLRRDA